MTPTAPLLVLFDIDGTLIHSAGAGRAAIETAMIEVYGTAGPIDDLPFDGLTDPRIVGRLLESEGVHETVVESRLNSLWEVYTAHLDREIGRRKDDMRIAPGVPALLDNLDQAGAALGLVTGNIVAGAQRKLDACDLWHRFQFGAYASDSADRNELPPIAIERAYQKTGTRFDPAATWIIGDTPQDIACAEVSRLPVLAVATGRFSVEDLVSAGATEAIETLENTDAVMSMLRSPTAGRANAP